MLTTQTTALAIAAAAVLAACGGGDDAGVQTPPTPTPQVTAVPDSAVASSTALVGYLKSQKTDDESSEALTLPSVDVATSETEEPQSL